LVGWGGPPIQRVLMALKGPKMFKIAYNNSENTHQLSKTAKANDGAGQRATRRRGGCKAPPFGCKAPPFGCKAPPFGCRAPFAISSENVGFAKQNLLAFKKTPLFSMKWCEQKIKSNTTGPGGGRPIWPAPIHDYKLMKPPRAHLRKRIRTHWR